ncbi:MAG: hypothetical protein V3T17_15910 [Pseudomonadales bacterium]
MKNIFIIICIAIVTGCANYGRKESAPYAVLNINAPLLQKRWPMAYVATVEMYDIVNENKKVGFFQVFVKDKVGVFKIPIIDSMQLKIIVKFLYYGAAASCEPVLDFKPRESQEYILTIEKGIQNETSCLVVLKDSAGTEIGRTNGKITFTSQH